MKHISKKIMAIALILVPVMGLAQANIQKEFDNLLNCKQATVVQSHSLDRDVTTREKTSQCDIYRFKLPENKIGLINNILEAFRQDDAMAYSTSSGTTTSGSDQKVQLAVGDGGTGVLITQPGREYIYSCFLAPESENAEGKYRYAYGMNWSYEKGFGIIEGTLVVTYATTLKYRQDNSVSVRHSNTSWFENVANAVIGFSHEKKYRQLYAKRIYELTRNCSRDSTVTEVDKSTAKQIITNCYTLKKGDKDYDPYVDTLLKSALENIK